MSDVEGERRGGVSIYDIIRRQMFHACVPFIIYIVFFIMIELRSIIIITAHC